MRLMELCSEQTPRLLAPKLWRVVFQTLRWFLAFQPYRIRYQAGLWTLRGIGICRFAQGPYDGAQQRLRICAVSGRCLAFWASAKFSRYKRAEDARMALEQMEGFELAGRTVGHSKSQTHRLSFNFSYSWESIQSTKRALCDTPSRIRWTKLAVRFDQRFKLFTNTFIGGNLNAASRQALMQKLARIEPAPKPQLVYVKFNYTDGLSYTYLQQQTEHSTSYAVPFCLIEEYVWPRGVSSHSSNQFSSNKLSCAIGKLNVTGIKSLPTMSKASVKKNMAE